MEYDLSDKLTAIIGVRYEHENVDFEYRQTYSDIDFVTANVFFVPPFTFNKALNGDDAVINKNYFSGTLELDWRPNEDMLIYASARRGIKPGAFNTPFAPIDSDRYKVKEEQLHAFELGTKLTLAYGALQVNGSIFYYDYKDYQAILSEGANTLLTNADATIYGLDLEVVARPSERLDIGFVLSVLEGNASDIQLNLPNGDVIVRDREVANAPKISGTAFARYEWPAFDGMLSIQGDLRYQDSVFFGVQNHPTLSGDAYVIGDMRIAWQNDRVEIAVFGKNLWEEEYIIYSGNNVDFGGYKFETPGKPRWLGIEVRYNWGN